MNSVKPSRTTLYLILLLLIASTSFAYWNIDKCEFSSFDDYQYVSRNYHVMSGFNKNNILWAFTSFYAGNWHPLTWLSHMLDCQLYDLKPAGHHLTNLFLHVFNTLLFFFVLKVMTGSVWRSALVAALFGLHPLHVESVAWVSERKDVLSTFFMFLTLLCYASYVFRKKRAFYFGALFLFALGLMTKPMIVTLPFILLLLDFWPLRRYSLPTEQILPSAIDVGTKRLGALFAEKIPFFVLAATSSIITLMAQHAGGAMINTEKLPVLARLSNAIISYSSYIGKMFWPANLTFFYPYSIIHPNIWVLIFSCLIIILISIIAVINLKKQPYIFTGWLWFLIMLVPVIGIVQVGTQAMADRYTYVPLIGLFIIIVWAIYDVTHQHRALKIIAVTGSFVLLSILILQTRAQAGYWKNDLALAERGLAVTKNNALAYTTKGIYLLTQKNYTEAHRCFYTSLLIDSTQTYSKFNIGWIYTMQGKPRQAIDIFNEILAKDPNNTLAFFNCGIAYGMIGDIKSSIRCYSRAIAVDSSYTPALHNLGLSYGVDKQYQKCKDILLQAVRRNPNDAEYFFSLGNCCFFNNNLQEAVHWFEKSIALDPDFPDSHRQLAEVYKSCGRPDLAQQHISIADSLVLLLTGKRK